MAEGMGIPFLGAVPLHMNMRINADEGTPLKNFEINEDITSTLLEICQHLAQQVSITTMNAPERPTLTISGQPGPSA